MHITMAAIGGAGHCFPLIPLATALAQRGHRVDFATTASMRDAVDGAGLDVVTLGREVPDALGQVLSERGLDAVPRDPDEFNVLGGVIIGDVVARAFTEDLTAVFASDRPDLVIADAGCPGAMLAAHRTGTRCVVHAVSRRLTGRGPFEEPLLRAFSGLAAEYGVDVPPDGTLLAHEYLNTFPASLDSADTPPEPPGRPIRPVPWNPPVTTRPSRPRADRPWVYVTFGTGFDGAPLLRGIVDELTGLDVDVLVSAGASATDDLHGLGDRVRVEPFVPQAELIGEFSLVVHHGGSGTTLAAAAHGVPQLVVPLGADQVGNADAVAHANLGRRLDALALAPGVVAENASALLGDGAHRDGARRVAAEIAAMPTPGELAADLEAWR